MTIQFVGLASETVTNIRRTRRDAYDLPVETARSDGGGIPCRHCLRETPAGQDYLILAHKPFAGTNAYTETGPIFLCADACESHLPGPDLPPMLASASYIVRAYSADERIRYGSGRVTPTSEIAAYAAELLEDPMTAFVDVRSAANNCFQCRIVRA